MYGTLVGLIRCEGIVSYLIDLLILSINGLIDDMI